MKKIPSIENASNQNPLAADEEPNGAPPPAARVDPARVNDEPPPPSAPNGPPEPPPAQNASASVNVADPFDPESLRLGQDFAAAVGVRKLLTTIPVTKPHKHSWVRANPAQAYRMQTAGLFLKVDREELYLVAPALWAELSNELRPVLIVTTISREGVLSMWPIKLPGPDGRHDTWNASALDAVVEAGKQWIRVVSNIPLGAYEILTTSAALAEPEWPTLPFRELLRIAFRDRMIESLDHPVLKRLRGEI